MSHKEENQHGHKHSQAFPDDGWAAGRDCEGSTEHQGLGKHVLLHAATGSNHLVGVLL